MCRCCCSARLVFVLSFVQLSTLIGMADDSYCPICFLQLASEDELRIHSESAIHILRTLKELGLPVVMCLLCRKFAVRSEDEHNARPYHLARAAQVPTWGDRPTLQVVVYPSEMNDELQRSQLPFFGALEAYYTEHIRMHFALFLEHARVEEVLAIDWPSPELSDSSLDDEDQFRTP